MNLNEALQALHVEYWRQCADLRTGDINCRLESGHGDDARRVEVTIVFGEYAFECTREQYGTWESCPIPSDRNDWRLNVLSK
jgi:hypothetical protein